MVKVINPLFSQSAHGKIGGMIYQSGRYGQIVRANVPQRFKPSAAQRQQNYFFGVAADNWRLLTPEEQADWNRKAIPFQMSGFNYFIKKTIEHPE